MTVYVLIYDVDNGSREDCNIFYSPIEVFATAAARQERTKLLAKTNDEIGWREEDLELQTTGNFEIPEHYLPYDDDEDEDDDSSDDDADEDNDEFAEGSEALTLLEELAEEVAPEPVNNGIDFSDDFMNLSLDDFLSAIENTVVLEEKRLDGIETKFFVNKFYDNKTISAVEKYYEKDFELYERVKKLYGKV